MPYMHVGKVQRSVLLGLRTAPKEDSAVLSAELVLRDSTPPSRAASARARSPTCDVFPPPIRPASYMRQPPTRRCLSWLVYILFMCGKVATGQQWPHMPTPSRWWLRGPACQGLPTPKSGRRQSWCLWTAVKPTLAPLLGSQLRPPLAADLASKLQLLQSSLQPEASDWGGGGHVEERFL
jgi:hypothetical protein